MTDRSRPSREENKVFVSRTESQTAIASGDVSRATLLGKLQINCGARESLNYSQILPGLSHLGPEFSRFESSSKGSKLREGTRETIGANEGEGELPNSHYYQRMREAELMIDQLKEENRNQKREVSTCKVTLYVIVQ